MSWNGQQFEEFFLQIPVKWWIVIFSVSWFLLIIYLIYCYKIGKHKNLLGIVNKIKEDNSNFLDDFEPEEIQVELQAQKMINTLYDLSWRKRDVDPQMRPFIREIEDRNEMFNHYGIKQSEVKCRLKQICSSMRPVRGDGNCFYTAFGYQFLQILLLKYSDRQLTQFIQQYKNQIPFFIQTEQHFNIDDVNGKILSEEFFRRLIFLRQITKETREEALFQHFSEYKSNGPIDGCFYGLSTIFFRNLSNYLVEFSVMKEAVYDRQNLLKWETECNSNEIVIGALAQYLHIHIQLIFFEKNDFTLREYRPQTPINDQQIEFPNIILLIKPGHYNIGLR